MNEPMLEEFRNEVGITRRILQRLPADKLTWKPHPKSMSLGELAQHIATVPGGIAKIAEQDSFDVLTGNFTPPQPRDLNEIHTAFEQSVREAEECIKGLTPQRAQAQWRLMRGDQPLLTQSRGAVVRTIMLNHWYHHRGQLSVYLRLLDVPVPVIYGRSADENPFA